MPAKIAEATEFNFDGLVGPTHNYAGLSYGNLASRTHQHSVSSPRGAALQGLRKMKFVRDLGIEQCVLPPLPRPNLQFLRDIGFSGDDWQIIEQAGHSEPALLAACYSASNMWTANAATVSPGSDCRDGRLHLTPANLVSNLHRSLEAAETRRVLRQIFDDEARFCVHGPLPANVALTDEGAANHTRLCQNFGQPGIELFVYGCRALKTDDPRPRRFPARQTMEACQAIARRHGLHPGQTLTVQQNPDAIDAGVFHNDVIAVGHQNVLLIHELAFCNQGETIRQLQRAFAEQFQSELQVVEISRSELPLADAVSSYLFNSQIVTRPAGVMALICPSECEHNISARSCIEKIIAADNPIKEVHFLDLRQSMNNGGGPACLRLRVVLDESQQSRFCQSVRLTDSLYETLVGWVEKHYRQELAPGDLRDPKLLVETRDAIQELESLLKLSLLSA
jgi:succinylarginine dihydrolase